MKLKIDIKGSKRGDDENGSLYCPIGALYICVCVLVKMKITLL